MMSRARIRYAVKGGLCHAEALPGSGPPCFQIEGAWYLNSRGTAQSRSYARSVRSDSRSRVDQRALLALARHRGREFRSADRSQAGSGDEDRALSPDGYRSALHAESRGGSRAYGPLQEADGARRNSYSTRRGGVQHRISVVARG